MSRVIGLLRRPLVLGALAVGAVALAAGLAAFQPWKLWVDETVEETVPVAAGPEGAARDSGQGKGDGDGASPPAKGLPDSGPTTLATGTLVSHEHATSGTVKVLRLSDGSRILRLEDLDTSNGPDLRVWITDAPVKEGVAGWRVFDDGRFESLGRLKGNKGSHNYPLPRDIDLGTYSSVSIWCDRFNVSFGAATLTPS